MFSSTTLFAMASATLFLLTLAAPTEPSWSLGKRAQPKGIAIFDYQGYFNWRQVIFSYVMATVGHDYAGPRFNQHFQGCKNAGLFCGTFHIAAPHTSNGTTQAQYFIEHGGRWTGDGKTLPGALALGYNSHGDICYGLKASAMVDWIQDFSKYYHAETTRYPIIATSYEWWKKCTDNDKSLSSTNELLQVIKSGRPGGWKRYSILQPTVPNESQLAQLKWNGMPAGIASFAHG